MKQSEARVSRWPEEKKPDEAIIRGILAEEGLHPYRWSNAPGDVYSSHTHSYNKVIYVLSGSITFGLPDSDEKLALKPGDRLDLPAGVSHGAVVGPEGVACLEAHR
jgi:quercetin dioxygenase-like cupin family protein